MTMAGVPYVGNNYDESTGIRYRVIDQLAHGIRANYCLP